MERLASLSITKAALLVLLLFGLFVLYAFSLALESGGPVVFDVSVEHGSTRIGLGYEVDAAGAPPADVLADDVAP